MAYAAINFKTKKALREAVESGVEVAVFSPGPFGCKDNGTEYIEGPHYPEPHRWYASVEVRNGVIVRVNK